MNNIENKKSINAARKKAMPLIQKKQFELRSCWNCNPAHEHLKTHELICCFECGHWFYKGIDITEED